MRRRCRRIRWSFLSSADRAHSCSTTVDAHTEYRATSCDSSQSFAFDSSIHCPYWYGSSSSLIVIYPCSISHFYRHGAAATLTFNLIAVRYSKFIFPLPHPSSRTRNPFFTLRWTMDITDPPRPHQIDVHFASSGAHLQPAIVSVRRVRVVPDGIRRVHDSRSVDFYYSTTVKKQFIHLPHNPTSNHTTPSGATIFSGARMVASQKSGRNLKISTQKNTVHFARH